jgi:putative glutamine amidotransferase
MGPAMTSHVKALIALLAPLLFACAAAPQKSPARPVPARTIDLDALGDRTVLLVTHPSPLIVRTIHALVMEKQLPLPKLLVIGLHHQQERERYDRSRQYLRDKGIDWMVLHQLKCPIERDKLFGANQCTPVFRKLLERAAGIIFNGGADIPPEVYGEKTLLTTVIRTPYRQFWEISFLAQLLGSSRSPGVEPLMKARPKFPVLGICMGLQAMNVATGGTLIQDIASEIYGAKTFEDILLLPKAARHRSAEHRLWPKKVPGPGVYHPLRFTGAPELWKSLHPHAEPVSVLSIHHQAIEKLGAKLEAIASSADGKVVEAVSHLRFPNVLAVQFHPEYYFLDRMLTAKGKLKKRIAPQPQDARTLAFHRRFWQRFVRLLAQP